MARFAWLLCGWCVAGLVVCGWCGWCGWCGCGVVGVVVVWLCGLAVAGVWLGGGWLGCVVWLCGVVVKCGWYVVR